MANTGAAEEQSSQPASDPHHAPLRTGAIGGRSGILATNGNGPPLYTTLDLWKYFWDAHHGGIHDLPADAQIVLDVLHVKEEELICIENPAARYEVAAACARFARALGTTETHERIVAQVMSTWTSPDPERKRELALRSCIGDFIQNQGAVLRRRAAQVRLELLEDYGSEVRAFARERFAGFGASKVDKAIDDLLKIIDEQEREGYGSCPSDRHDDDARGAIHLHSSVNLEMVRAMAVLIRDEGGTAESGQEVVEALLLGAVDKARETISKVLVSLGHEERLLEYAVSPHPDGIDRHRFNVMLSGISRFKSSDAATHLRSDVPSHVLQHQRLSREEKISEIEKQFRIADPVIEASHVEAWERARVGDEELCGRLGSYFGTSQGDQSLQEILGESAVLDRKALNEFLEEQCRSRPLVAGIVHQVLPPERLQVENLLPDGVIDALEPVPVVKDGDYAGLPARDAVIERNAAKRGIINKVEALLINHPALDAYYKAEFIRFWHSSPITPEQLIQRMVDAQEAYEKGSGQHLVSYLQMRVTGKESRDKHLSSIEAVVGTDRKGFRRAVDVLAKLKPHERQTEKATDDEICVHVSALPEAADLKRKAVQKLYVTIRASDQEIREEVKKMFEIVGEAVSLLGKQELDRTELDRVIAKTASAYPHLRTALNDIFPREAVQSGKPARAEIIQHMSSLPGSRARIEGVLLNLWDSVRIGDGDLVERTRHHLEIRPANETITAMAELLLLTSGSLDREDIDAVMVLGSRNAGDAYISLERPIKYNLRHGPWVEPGVFGDDTIAATDEIVRAHLGWEAAYKSSRPYGRPMSTNERIAGELDVTCDDTAIARPIVIAPGEQYRLFPEPPPEPKKKGSDGPSVIVKSDEKEKKEPEVVISTLTLPAHAMPYAIGAALHGLGLEAVEVREEDKRRGGVVGCWTIYWEPSLTLGANIFTPRASEEPALLPESQS